MSLIVDQLLAKAMTLTYNDGGLVKRLVNASISKEPKKPAQWHLETVIWQLERDRA